MKRNTDQISRNENEKKRGPTSTPKNPQKKQKNDEGDMKAKRQINFKSKEPQTDCASGDQAQAPVSKFTSISFARIQILFYNSNLS